MFGTIRALPLRMGEGADDGHNRAQREILAQTVDQRRGDIEQRWLARVSEDLPGRGISVPELRNAIPDYLRSLAQALRGEHAIEVGGSAAWAEVAREHALTRVRLGFDIDELVREFIVLRRILFDVAREEGLLTDTHQADRLVELLEAGIAASVKSYVDSRDFATRRKEAEHVAFVAHELRNPLTTITIGLRRLQPLLRLSEKESRTLDLVMRSVMRLGELIDSVLDVQRFEAGYVEPKTADVTLGELLGALVASAQAASDDKGLRFVARFDAAAVIHVDPKLTISAIENVLGNAIKYTDNGRIELVAESGPEDVTVHVRDDCHGISEEELATIFEPFRRGHSTGKPGTGLGLAIARRAMEAQGGSIHAESKGERGCHFWLTLPRRRVG